MPESKIKMLLEFGCIQGGVYMEGDELKVCEGVKVEGEENEAQNKTRRATGGKTGGGEA